MLPSPANATGASRRQWLRSVALGAAILAPIQDARKVPAQTKPVSPPKGKKHRPKVVAFDVVETLFSLKPMQKRFQDAGLPKEALSEWFPRFLRDAMTLDATGVYQNFRAVATATLEVLLVGHGLKPSKTRINEILEGFAELPAHPDVLPAFKAWQAAGIPIFTLTNGSAGNTRKLLQRAGLDKMVKKVISIDEVKRWKPSKEVYLHAAKVAGVKPGELALVAAHSWDVHGAAQAGLVTGWVSRLEKRFHPLMSTPDVKGATLVEVSRELLALK